jgi:hypothetical protein
MQCPLSPYPTFSIHFATKGFPTAELEEMSSSAAYTSRLV